MVSSALLLQDMAVYNAPDVRRVNHALKVYGFACMLGKSENLPEKEQLTLEFAAALHDIGIHAAEQKYGSSAGPYQEKEGPAIVREMLEKRGVSPEMTARVCQLIGRHHTYTNIDGQDCQLLIEADFLVNLDEDGASQETVQNVRKNIFRSTSGKTLLDALFLQ